MDAISLQLLRSASRNRLLARTGDLFIRAVKILTEDFRHRKHVYTLLFEHGAHRVVAANLTSVARILKIMLVDIFPKLLDGLWPRELPTQLDGILKYDCSWSQTVAAPSNSESAGERLRGFWSHISTGHHS